MNTTAIAQHSGGEHYHEHEQEKKKKQKYTCPMHPEVVIDHPGNCPKCGMKLVPVAEKKRSTPNLTSQGYGAADLQRPTSHSRHATADANSMAMPHHEHGGHEMHMEMHSSIDIADPMSREGSGTSWLPDSSPMYGRMFMFDENTLMLHGAIFPRYTNVSTRRGDDRIDALDWIMAMFSHPLGNNAQFGARLMMSLDPLTEGGRGYPLLFQSGESWHDQPLHDRQHPHDLFDELSVSLSQKFDYDLSAYFYFGYPGEPALGPPTFMHRPSAMDDPDAPLGHHWQDSTHVTFGVATGGELLYSVTGIGVPARLQVEEQLLDVLRRAGLQPFSHGSSDRPPLRGYQCLVEQGERAPLRLACIGRQRSPARLRVRPAGGDRDEFLVQSGCTGAIQTQAPEQDHTGDRIGRLRKTRPGQVMVDEPLGSEATEQALHYALFQVQVDNLVIHRARVFEDDGTNRGGATPFPDPLLALTGSAQGVHGLGPCGVGPVPLIHGREGKPGRTRRGAIALSWREGLGAH